MHEKIKLVPMDMTDKPGWYKEVYPNNQVWLVLHGKKRFEIISYQLMSLRFFKTGAFLRAQEEDHRRELWI